MRGFSLVQGRDGTTLKGRATFAFLQRHCRALRSGDLGDDTDLPSLQGVLFPCHWGEPSDEAISAGR